MLRSIAKNRVSASPEASAAFTSPGDESAPLAEGSALVAMEPLRLPPPPSASRRILLKVLGPALVLGLVVGIWYFVTYIVLSPSRRFLLPPVHTVISVSFMDSANLGQLMSGLGMTVKVALIGLLIAILIGVFIAIVMSEAQILETGLYPYLVILQTIPILALVPLIGFWLGFGFTSRVVICVLIALFPIIANTLFGLQSSTQPLRELFQLHKAGRLTTLWKLKIPLALPAVFAGFRISAGLSVIGEIVGGFYFQRGTPDLGVLLQEYMARLNGPMLFGAIILSSLLGVIVFTIFGAVGKMVVGRWKE